MEYLTTKETAKKWGVNVSLARRYCTQERIPGVIQRDGAWLIPEDAKRPMKIEPGVKEPVVLPALAQKLLRQKKKKSFHGLYDYVQINLTYSSCRMASNRLTRQQVETIFRKGKVSVSFEPMKVSDLVEVLNHCVCVDYILDHNRGWSEPPHTVDHHPDMPETLSKSFQRSAFPAPPIQLQISSLIKISSICAVNVFISPTQRIGSQAFSSSVTPAASIM